MKRHPRIPVAIIAPSGQSLSEYGFILGLVVVLGIGVVLGTGQQLNGMLQTGNTRMFGNGESGKTGELAQLAGLLGPSSSQTQIESNPFDTNFGSPAPDKPLASVRLQLKDGTNTTSIDGFTSPLGSGKVAVTLDALAQKSTGDNRDYLERLANMSYLMGGIEAELDGSLDLDDYNNGMALRELIQKNHELGALIQNPPETMDPNTRAIATALSQEVLSIGQQYQSKLSSFIQPNGDVMDFAVSKCEKTSQGCILSDKSKIKAQDVMATADQSLSIENKTSLSALKEDLLAMLNDNNLGSDPLVTTVTDARHLDNAATTQSSAPPQ